MIANDVLATVAIKYQTTELNVRREYMQHLFLSYFYQQPQAKEIYFKGGTALRIVYGSPRFSEDLDFGSTLHDIDEIERAVLATLIEVQREGISSDIIESKKTSGGYLAVIDFVLGKTVIRLRFEASFREKELESETETIVSDFIPPYIINSLAQEQLIGGKIAALLDRRKPRDFYDLYYLLQKGFVSTQQKALMQQVVPLIEQTDINFTQELKQFLPQSQWPIIKDFKTVLGRAVKRFV
jgi:predicted nucleotidyltransferase component of viral defense system